jgi:hypothetical protein
MKRIFIQYKPIFLIAVLLFSGLTFSLSQPTGSPYTRYGIGDLNYYPNARAVGMGGAGIAIPSNNTIDLNNPAAWTRITLTRFSVGATFNGLTTTDAANSARYGNLNFNDVMLAIPLSTPNGVVFAFGLSRYSTVGYNVHEEITQSGYSYSLVHQGEGGISQAHFGLSAKIGSDLHLGAKFNYYFGTIQHNITQEFSNSLYSTSTVERQLQLKGPGLTLGAIYSGFTNILHLESSVLNIGAAINTSSYMRANQETYVKSSNGENSTSGGNNAFDTTKSELTKLKIPFRLITGISYITEQYTLAADVAIQNWDDRWAIGILIPMTRNTYRLSFGGELTPKREQSAPYFQRVSYRLGTFYYATYYMLNNQPVNEFGLTGGFTLPFPGDTRVNIGGEYGMRGTTDFGLQKEKYFRLTFSLSGGEPWFVRPPED